jgi:glycosyltransferase involved in cell wall biosynthesis
MEISIIIPTIKPILNLRELIKIILDTNKTKIEIIIVHQGVKGKENIFKDKRVKQINIYKKSLSYAKNVGIKSSKYKIITFIDDDVLINNNYLLSGAKIILKNKNISLLFGSIYTNDKQKLSLNLLNKDAYIDYSNFLTCIASSMWINNKKYILKKKFFDNNFGLGAKYGSGEETDYVLNALLEDRKILFTPNLKVFHPTDIKSSKEYMKYAIGNGAVYKKFLRRNLLFFKIFIKSILISMILIVFYGIMLNKKKSGKYIVFLIGRMSGFIKYKY